MVVRVKNEKRVGESYVQFGSIAVGPVSYRSAKDLFVADPCGLL